MSDMRKVTVPAGSASAPARSCGETADEVGATGGRLRPTGPAQRGILAGQGLPRPLPVEQCPAHGHHVDQAHEAAVVHDRQVLGRELQHPSRGLLDRRPGLHDRGSPQVQLVDPGVVEVAAVGHRLAHVGVGDDRDRDAAVLAAHDQRTVVGPLHQIGGRGDVGVGLHRGGGGPHECADGHRAVGHRHSSGCRVGHGHCVPPRCRMGTPSCRSAVAGTIGGRSGPELPSGHVGIGDSGHDHHSGHGCERLRQVDRRRHAGRPPGLGVRRGRRLPPRGERREDARRAPAGRRGPLALAAHPGRLDRRARAGRTQRRRHLFGAQARLPRRAPRRPSVGLVRVRRGRPRPDPRAPRAPDRPLHARVAARQPAGYPRAAGGRRARTSDLGGLAARLRRRRTAGRARRPAWPLPEHSGGTVMTLLAAAKAGSDFQLILAAVLGIALVVVLITWLKVDPFLALILGSLLLGIVAGLPFTDTITSFQTGVGATVGSVGVLIALGAMIGGLLAESGGADRVVTAVVDRVSPRRLPWAMAGVAALIGIPLFFEVGVVLLVPIVLLVARRTRLPVLAVGIPALAGLSVLHGLVPPHPGPLVAIAALHADLGRTLLFGLICAIPCVILAGPVFGTWISRRLDLPVPVMFGSRENVNRDGDASGPVDDLGGVTRGGQRTAIDTSVGTAVEAPPRRLPGLGATIATVLLPVVLMLLRAIGELTLDKGNGVRSVLDVIGTPMIALLAGVVLAMFTLGTAVGFGRQKISATLGGSLPAIAGILLIVAAGGGFKQVLVDAGVGDLVGRTAQDWSINALVLGWLVAVGIRLATGSATVATITAAGIVAPLAGSLDSSTVALLALAIGSGSLFFSHVNDAGFWLVKEYFGMTVGQTIKSWSVMETIISVVGLLGVLVLSVVV